MKKLTILLAVSGILAYKVFAVVQPAPRGSAQVDEQNKKAISKDRPPKHLEQYETPQERQEAIDEKKLDPYIDTGNGTTINKRIKIVDPKD